MFWSPEKKFKKLVTRYLDPTQTWSGADDAKMRKQIRESETFRTYYDQRITAHRLMLDMDAETPSAIEKKRLMTATVDLSLANAPATENAIAWWRSPAFSGAMGVAALLVAVYAGGFFGNGTDPATPAAIAPSGGPSGEYLGTRGGEKPDRRGGFGVTGQTLDGERNYEVVRGDGAYLEDGLRFSYQCSDPSLKYLFIFAIQADASKRDGWTTHWYYPLGTEEETLSIAVECGESTERAELQGRKRLSQRHLEGAISVIGIYSQEPLTLTDVARRLENFDPSAYLAELETTAVTAEFVKDLNDSLGLDETDATSILTFQINTGSKGQLDEQK